MKKGDSEKLKLFITVFVLVFLGFICVASPRLTGYEIISDKAGETVKDALAENMKIFIVVSGLKAGLAIVEGSTAGAVIVDVEIGDIVQPSYDFVDHIWQFLFYGLLILSMYEFILEYGLLSLGIRIVGIGLLAWGLSFLLPAGKSEDNAAVRILASLKKRVPVFARASLMIGFLLAYLVPVTLIVTYGVRGYITEPVKARKYEEIRAFEKKIDRLKEDFLSVKEELSVTQPVESSNRVKTKIRAIATSLLDSFNSSLQIFLYYIVIIFIEILVFPLLTAYILYRLGQLAIGSFPSLARPSRRPEVSVPSEA